MGPAHDREQHPARPHAVRPRTTEAHALTPTPPADAPGATSYHRLTALAPVLRVRCAPPRRGDGWIPAADLTTRPEAVRELIAHDARQGLARYGRPLRPDVAAGFGLHRVVWPLSLLFTLPWFLERRVLLLGPEDVSVRRGADRVELTVRPEAFACLPDDPAGGVPQARTVPDANALATELRCALGGFLEPVLAAFRPEVRRGRGCCGRWPRTRRWRGSGTLAGCSGSRSGRAPSCPRCWSPRRRAARRRHRRARPA